MNKFENVRKVKCKKNKCMVFHDNIEEEIDVDGIIMEGETTVRGAETEVTFEDGKCKEYGEVLVCKDGGEW